MPIQWTETDRICRYPRQRKAVKEDYPEFAAAFDMIVRQHGKQRVLFDITGFHSWDAGAAWEDIRVRH